MKEEILISSDIQYYFNTDVLYIGIWNNSGLYRSYAVIFGLKLLMLLSAEKLILGNMFLNPKAFVFKSSKFCICIKKFHSASIYVKKPRFSLIFYIYS